VASFVLIGPVDNGLNASEESTMVLQQACIDDSGTGAKGTFALAGYILSVDDWKVFSDQWQQVLSEQPPLAYLKMKQAATLEGGFKGWRATERDTKLRKLVSVLRNFNVLAVTSSLRGQDYADVVKGRFPAGFDNPYFFCFYDLIVGLVQYQRRRQPNWTMQFVFDDQGGLGRKTAGWYCKLKNAFSVSIQALMGATPDFRTDTGFPPLQAADALAWTTRRNREETSKPCPLPLDVLRGLYEVPMLDWQWDRARLSNFVLDSKDIAANLRDWEGRLKSVEGDTKLGFKARAVFKR
jgi:hypothetical protein